MLFKFQMNLPKDGSLLGCYAVQSSRNWPTFRGLMDASSTSENFGQFLPDYPAQYPRNRFIFIAVRTWNLNSIDLHDVSEASYVSVFRKKKALGSNQGRTLNITKISSLRNTNALELIIFNYNWFSVFWCFGRISSRLAETRKPKRQMNNRGQECHMCDGSPSLLDVHSTGYWLV